MESAAEAHAKDLATAVTANEVKRDKLLNSLSHVDRSKILAEEQEREANMAHYNNDIDPEAALALALRASVAQTQEEEARPSTSGTSAEPSTLVSEAFEKVHADSDQEISSDLCVISICNETIAESLVNYPVDSDMGTAAFPSEVAGSTDETGVVQFVFEPGSNALAVTLSNKPVLRVVPDPNCSERGAPVRYEWIDTSLNKKQQARGISLCYAFAKHVHQDKARAASARINELRKKPNNNLKLTEKIEMKHYVRGLIGALRMVSQLQPVDPEITKVCEPHALGEKTQRMLETFPVYFDTCANVHFAPSLCVKELELFVDSLNATKVRGISSTPLVTAGQANNIPIFAVTEDHKLFRCKVTAQVADLAKFVLSAMKLIESGDAIGVLALDPETKKLGSFLQMPGGAIVALSKMRNGMLILGKNDKHCEGGTKSEPVPIHRLVKEMLRRDKLRQESLQRKGDIPVPGNDLETLLATEVVEGTTASDVACSAKYYEALMAAINATVEEEEVYDKCAITEAMLATEDALLEGKEVPAEDLEQRHASLLESASQKRQEYQKCLQALKVVEARQDVENKKSDKSVQHDAVSWHNTMHKNNTQMLTAARESNILMECCDGGKPRQGDEAEPKS